MSLELAALTPTFQVYTTGADEARFIYREIFDQHCYDDHRPFLSSPGPPLIIDAGANIGLFSIYFRRKYPGARVLAFEPAPATYGALRRNLELHAAAGGGGGGGVRAHPFGLAAAAGRLPLTYYPLAPGNSTLRPGEKEAQHADMREKRGREVVDRYFGGAREVEVELRRLSDVLDESGVLGEGEGGRGRVDLLKVDVEGAELEVLRGVDDGHWGVVDNVMVETTSYSGVKGKIEEFLRERGFVVSCKGAPNAPDRLFMISGYRAAAYGGDGPGGR